ncbi:MAG: hypothetical protein F6K58_17170 [Symploca sp. SIO2E9]|nr:hypothetical protein [Symploca sp. SIO2E9]
MANIRSFSLCSFVLQIEVRKVGSTMCEPKGSRTLRQWSGSRVEGQCASTREHRCSRVLQGGG